MSERIKVDKDEISAMVAVSKYEFLPGLPLPTDVYVQLPNEKFVMIARKGEKKSLGDLHVGQNEGVTTFFVPRADYLTGVEQNIRIAGILIRKSDISVSRRSVMLQTSAQSVYNSLEHLGVSSTMIGHSKSTVESVVTLVSSREDYFQVIDALGLTSDRLTKTSLAGSALAVIVAREMGWTSKESVEKLALAAFLRDVGMKEIPAEVLKKTRMEMNEEERAIWESHAFRGAQLLQTIRDLPPEVIQVALEHHENAIGQGFPRRLRDPKMHSFSKLISLVDFFVDLTMARPLEKTYTAESAMHLIEYGYGSPYNKACVISLKRALNIKDGTHDGSDSGGSSEAA
jgi:HD-GYP domain-containing protein (c-di-GMP phosphodiesterase class II)